jgi:hypothetical protein
VSGPEILQISAASVPRDPRALGRRLSSCSKPVHLPFSGVPSRNVCLVLHFQFHVGILLGFLDPEDGGDMFFRNVGSFSTDYTALYTNRQNM